MDYLKVSEVDTVQECETCGDFFPVPAQTEIGLAALSHRKNCFAIKDGFHVCLSCGTKLKVSSKDEVPERLHLHTVDCALHFRKKLLSNLWESAKNELRGIVVGSDEERRATLERYIAEYKKKLDDPRALRQEIESMIKQEESEQNTILSARGANRYLGVEQIDGKIVLVTKTPKKFFDKNWERIEDNRWRRPEHLVDGTMIWADYPSTAEGNAPNPHARCFAKYLRFETKKELEARRERGHFEAMTVWRLIPV